MDNLQVTPLQATNSKTSSRSASPCRLRHESHDSHIAHLSSRDVDISIGRGSGSSGSSSFRGRQRSPTTGRRDDELTLTPLRTMSAHHGYPHDEYQATLIDLEHYPEYLASISLLSNGSSEHVVSCDEGDSNPINRTLVELQEKILKTKGLIRQEQTTRDDNVNEYLKLAANADKQQLQRIKAVFEKKNQKSAHSIAQLQKKLENYTKRMRDAQTQGPNQGTHKQTRGVLRDMGQGLKNVGGNIRDGITGFSGSVMSKPREFAHLIKNKFGSADNINQLTSRNGADNSGGESSGQEKAHHGSATLPGGCALNSSGPVGHSSNAVTHKFPSEEGSECSSVTSESIPGSGRIQATSNSINSLKPIFTELQERREDYERLREKLDRFSALQQEVQFISNALQEERFKSERLEEQINDLTELHQNEVENLKQALADMEEKVQYQSEERLRDIHEMLEHCQTKICKMEHQALQQQQYVTLEGIDNSNARALVVKLINVVLTVLQVILLLVATAAGITMPFLRTRVRILTTVLLILLIVFVIKQWPEVKDIGVHVVRHLKEMLDVK
uniref:Putative conserved plasma membrane protein n=1 Tax=Xenopsylla cheopis TaxID=163159 RepID=A0A6M2DPZ6_XENCH